MPGRDRLRELGSFSSGEGSAECGFDAVRVAELVVEGVATVGAEGGRCDHGEAAIGVLHELPAAVGEVARYVPRVVAERAQPDVGVLDEGNGVFVPEFAVPDDV